MNKYGAPVTVLLVAIIIFGLFHNIILNANQVSFAESGDGLKSTFGTVYHLKYDSSYWHTDAMNYPFGESLFFTGNQVVLTNSLKLIKDAGWDLSEYALGISNILILLSFVIASLFIYLIFRELNVDWWMAMVATIMIIMLSNQWERLGGHYNLAYAYIIPVILYLLLRFYRNPGYLISVIFGLVVLLFSAKQLYIAAFILVLWVPYWIFLPLHNRDKFGKPAFIASHLLIQFILPFLLFILFTGMHDPVPDRTAFPWGFFPSRVKLETVFLPLGQPHGEFLPYNNRVIRMKAYVGLLGTVVAAIILIRTVAGLIRKDPHKAFAVTENPAWNILFWAGVLSLLVAIGVPFSLRWERLLNYTGPFRQFRAIGRFVFPFYYIMTITSFYILWRWFKSSRLRFRTIILLAILLFTGYESYFKVMNRPRVHHNWISWFSDLKDTPEYEWTKRHDFKNYQAIIPLPFFHVGSENYWVGDRSPVQAQAFAASLKTGLPLSAVMLSRTSISQSLLNLDLVLEPYHDYPVLRQLPSQKPFLVIRHKDGALTLWERGLVNKARPIDESRELEIYSLETDSIRSLLHDRKMELTELAERAEKDPGIVYNDFSGNKDGVLKVRFKDPVTFLNTVIPDTGWYEISFWYEGADRDLWPRTSFWTELYGEGESQYLYFYSDLFRKMVLREGSWGLIEYPVHVEEPNSTLKVTIYNKVITKGSINLDQLLVRPAGKTHIIRNQGLLQVNNRILLSEAQ